MSGNDVYEYRESDLIKARNEGREKGFKDGIAYACGIHEVQFTLNWIKRTNREGIADLVDAGIVRLARAHYDKAKQIFSDGCYQNEEEKNRLRILGERLEKAEREIKEAQQKIGLIEKV